MEREVIENEEVRAAVRDIIRENSDVGTIYQLTYRPDQQLCIILENGSSLTVSGREDGLIEVRLDCPSINVHANLHFEIVDFM